MSVMLETPELQEINSPAMHQRINALRTIDNVTNWFYLIREYLLVAAVVGATICFYWNYEAWGLSWLWNLPLTFVAVVLIGAGQHRLTNLAHEASHYMLFRHRLLN